MKNLINLCQKYNLGNLQKPPEIVTGGLLHKMYHVTTDQGEYAIKLLNPGIMKRAHALQNTINSEIVSNALASVIPVVAAKHFKDRDTEDLHISGKHIIKMDSSFYVIFDWLDGKSIFAPDITAYHCEQIGRILGKIHAANIKIDGIEKSQSVRAEYDWNMLLGKAGQYNQECYLILQENLPEVVRWDKYVVSAFPQVSQYQVISHRDLDPKNVMWKNDKPHIIDWEAAGYVNPFQELIEVLNYWISDETGKYSKTKFDALMQAYTESMNICNVNWDAVLDCSFDGMLGWLEYSIKRAMGMEGTETKDRQEGMQQTKDTIRELKKYENQMKQLKGWINEFVSKK